MLPTTSASSEAVFWLDGANLGAEDMTSPYSRPWDTELLPWQSHLTAWRAMSQAGNTTTSDAVIVTVSTHHAPSVSTLAKLRPDGRRYRDVSANATDNVAVVGVQFLVDGTPIGQEDSTAPYSVAWDTRTTTNGSHT